MSGFLAVLQECIFYSVELIEVRKISDVFCVKLHCKVNNFLPVFLALRLSAGKSKIKR